MSNSREYGFGGGYIFDSNAPLDADVCQAMKIGMIKALFDYLKRSEENGTIKINGDKSDQFYQDFRKEVGDPDEKIIPSGITNYDTGNPLGVISMQHMRNLKLVVKKFIDSQIQSGNIVIDNAKKNVFLSDLASMANGPFGGLSKA